jgi:hypothetical protein
MAIVVMSLAMLGVGALMLAGAVRRRCHFAAQMIALAMSSYLATSTAYWYVLG